MGMCMSHDVMFIIVIMCLHCVRSMGIYDRAALIRWRFEMLYHPCENGVQAGTVLEVGKDEWTFAAHARVAQSFTNIRHLPEKASR